jgi:hypothetical protein
LHLLSKNLAGMTKIDKTLRILKIESFVVGGLAILSGIVNAVIIMLLYQIESVGFLAALVIIFLGILIISEGTKLKKDPIKHTDNLITISVLFIIGIGMLQVQGLLILFLIGLALSAGHLKRVIKKSEVSK